MIINTMILDIGALSSRDGRERRSSARSFAGSCPRILWLGLALVFALSMLPGCMPGVAQLSPAPTTPVPAATVVPQQHALAIMAVDFDPPLDYAQILSRGGVSLLVAVENEGLSAESDVQVTARLLDSTDRSRPRELLNETLTLKTLAAGELRVVCFSQVSELPRQDRYQLQVQVEPAPGEADTSDNFRTYDILIRQED